MIPDTHLKDYLKPTFHMLIQIFRYCGLVAVSVTVNAGSADDAEHKMSTRSTGYSIGFLQFNFPS